MKTNMPKIVQCLVPVGFLFVAFFLDPVIVLAERREPQILRAKETIDKFLSSVELGEPDYSFDHDSDGIADISVYPLMTTRPDLKTEYITLQEA
ncbi:MAG: hypothetical protein ACYSTZ_13175, partial [Planctomycetota bacterium]